MKYEWHEYEKKNNRTLRNNVTNSLTNAEAILGEKKAICERV